MVNRFLRIAFLGIVLLSGCQSAIPTDLPGSTAIAPTALAETAEPTKAAEIVQQATPLPTAAQPVIAASPTAGLSPEPTSTREPAAASTSTTAPSTGSGTAIIVDHTSVDLFDQIPDEYLEAARNLKMMYADRSVGQNINEALDCLSAVSWAKSPAYCRRDYPSPFVNSQTYMSNPPARINFTPDPQKYDRTSWKFEILSGEWYELNRDFIETVAPKFLDQADVLSYQITYLNVVDGSDIADPEKGFFADTPDRSDIHDLEAFMAQHPDKTFILWTTSLARSIGTQVSDDFNDQMRNYALEHNKILFDVADIESHTDLGAPCYDNRDGIEYCGTNGECENHPDDGKENLAICQDYTTETDGGHLGSVSSGKLRIAKGFWVLMAQIAGWKPQTQP